MPRPTNLSFELIETYVTLIRNGGDAALTAAQLGINQPSMSKRLMHLRKGNDVLREPWLERHGKKWRMTEEGERVWPAVQQLFIRYQELRGYSASVPPHAPLLQVACGETAAINLVRIALKKWSRLHPGMPVRIATMPPAERVAAVASGAFDMALVDRHVEQVDEQLRRGLEYEEIASYGYYLVCAKEREAVDDRRRGRRDEARMEPTPWAAAVSRLAKSNVPLSTLADFPLIVPQANSYPRMVLDRILARQAWADRVRIVVEASGWLSMLAYVRDGLGVGLLTEGVTPIEQQDNRLLWRRIDPGELPPQSLILIKRKGLKGEDGEIERKDGALTEIAKDWANALREAAREWK